MSKTLTPEHQSSISRRSDFAFYTTAQEKYSYRERYLKANQSILKSTIMLKFVTKEMEDKLRDETDFNTTLDNPIELLIRIEGFIKKTDDGNYKYYIYM